MSVCCKCCVLTEVSATDQSLVQRNATECDVTEYDREGCWAMGKWSRLVLNFTQLDIGWKLWARFSGDKAVLCS